MSRSGYSEDYDFSEWSSICWRGAVTSAIKGKRGQTFLKEMLKALDQLPEKRLIAGDLEKNGGVCAIGSVGKIRQIDMSTLDPEDADTIAKTFGVAPALVREIEYENDEAGRYLNDTPENRYNRVYNWVKAQIKS